MRGWCLPRRRDGASLFCVVTCCCVLDDVLSKAPCGRVGEWLKPADCKSAAPCGLRRFESSPVHHFSGRAASTARTRRAQQRFNSEQGAKTFTGAPGIKCRTTLHGIVRG